MTASANTIGSAPATGNNPAPATGNQTPSQNPNGQPNQTAEQRRMKLKIDGKEVEMSESEVVSYATKARAADQRFDEAANIRKEAEQVLKFAKDNPEEFFKRTGMNAREWAEQYLLREIERERMSPEQKKALENEEKLRKYEDGEKLRIETERKAQIAALEKQHLQNYDLMFTEALQKSGLPKTAYTVKRMAELQLVNVKKKLELKPDQLAKLVREDYASEQKALLSGYDGDQLIEFLGPDVVKKLSKAQIAKLKSRGVTPRQTTPDKPAGKRQLTWDEYKKQNRKRR